MGISLAAMHSQDMLILAQEAHEAGLHLTSVGDYIDNTLAMLAAVGAVTHHIKLVSNIAACTRTPVTTARAMPKHGPPQRRTLHPWPW